VLRPDIVICVWVNWPQQATLQVDAGFGVQLARSFIDASGVHHRMEMLRGVSTTELVKPNKGRRSLPRILH